MKDRARIQLHMTRFARITKAGLPHEADWGTAIYARLSRDDMHLIGAKRNDWIVIVNEETGECIYRMVRGSSEAGFEKGSIRIDYDGAKDLDSRWIQRYYETHGSRYYEKQPADTFVETTWAIAKCSLVQKVRAYWNYPDQGYQFSLKIALISFAIGFVGLLVGIIDLVLNIVS